jgi:hypothetical protein
LKGGESVTESEERHALSVTGDMGTYIHRFLVILFIACVGFGIWGSGVVHADGSFDVPEVNDQFNNYGNNPAPTKEQPITTQPVNEEKGILDRITEPISDAWDWTVDKVSSAWEWTKETASNVWDWFVGILSKITEVVVDALSAVWDWILEHKAITIAILSIIGVIVAVVGFVFEVGLALLIGAGILLGEIIGGLSAWLSGNEWMSDEMLRDIIIGGIAGGISTLFGWLAGASVSGTSLVSWIGSKIPWLGRSFPAIFGSGVGAGVDQSITDLLKTGKIDPKKTMIVTGLGFLITFGGGYIGSHFDDIVTKINNLSLSPVTQIFENGTASAPKTIGDTQFGQWLQKFAATTDSKTTGKVTKNDLVPGSPEHKAQRWKEYQARGGKYTYEQWSKVYEGNMGKANKSHQMVDEYRKKLDWEGITQVSIETPYGRRILDIANEELKKAIEHKTSTKKEGVAYFSRSERIREEIAKDTYLVQKGWDITWVFERADASEPLIKELEKNGIKVKFEE